MNLRECLEAARINVLVRERVSSRADVEVVAIKEARLAVRRGRLQAGGKKDYASEIRSAQGGGTDNARFGQQYAALWGSSIDAAGEVPENCLCPRRPLIPLLVWPRLIDIRLKGQKEWTSRSSM